MRSFSGRKLWHVRGHQRRHPAMRSRRTSFTLTKSDASASGCDTPSASTNTPSSVTNCLRRQRLQLNRPLPGWLYLRSNISRHQLLCHGFISKPVLQITKPTFLLPGPGDSRPNFTAGWSNRLYFNYRRSRTGTGHSGSCRTLSSLIDKLLRNVAISCIIFLQ